MIWLLAYLALTAVFFLFFYAACEISSPRRAVSNQPPSFVQTPARGTTVETRKDAEQPGASPVS